VTSRDRSDHTNPSLDAAAADMALQTNEAELQEIKLGDDHA
jgi:hypothetical protein